MNEFEKYLAAITEKSPQSIVLSNRINEFTNFKKTKIRPISDYEYQLESYTDKQSFHKNVKKEKLFDEIKNLFAENYRQLDATDSEFIYCVKLSKKGKVLFNRIKNTSDISKTTSHNRDKNYILKDGEYVPALFELGIISADGKVKNSSYDKFKQINRFAELIDDIVRKDKRESYNIIDFGCGKSYLTFVLYHYMTKIADKRVNIVGLDLKKDVIENCNAVAQKYGYENLKFFCGDIKDYKADFKPDMVISLHACDTATDFAIYNAISWGADYILSVPCCQHEMNLSIKQDKNSLLYDYGIIKERLCALATDSVRAKLLEYKGYETQVLEFIDISHSPKNILIRARKTSRINENSFISAREFIEQYKAKSTLYELINSEQENMK